MRPWNISSRSGKRAWDRSPHSRSTHRSRWRRAPGLGLRVDDETGSFELIEAPGENGVLGWDPSPGLGESAAPNDNFPVYLPAFQIELEKKVPAPPPNPPPAPPPLKQADVSIAKTRITKRRPGIGGNADFNVLVKNLGPDEATGVVFYDTFDEPDLIFEEGPGFFGPKSAPRLWRCPRRCGSGR